jgi:hypothetical protein
LNLLRLRYCARGLKIRFEEKKINFKGPVDDERIEGISGLYNPGRRSQTLYIYISSFLQGGLGEKTNNRRSSDAFGVSKEFGQGCPDAFHVSRRKQ